MQRIIKASEFREGYIPHNLQAEVRRFNENPTFDKKTKPYTFVGKIKSSTKNYGWQIEYEGQYFMIMNHKDRYSEFVSVFECDKKQKYDLFGALKTYPMYVDIETVTDMWFEEHFGIKIEKLSETNE